MKDVFDQAFAPYGKIIEGYDTAGLLAALESATERPGGHVIYVPSEPVLEALPVMQALSDGVYGGMPIQLGYCNGSNRRMNCLEYHRGAELNIPADDVVLLVASMQKIVDGKLGTQEVEAFFAPKNSVVLLYETTLHYAPCNYPGSDGFRVVIVLPRGTNTQKPDIPLRNLEDRLLTARNKWLIAHPEAPEAAQGAFVGLTGENVTIL